MWRDRLSDSENSFDHPLKIQKKIAEILLERIGRNVFGAWMEDPEAIAAVQKDAEYVGVVPGEVPGTAYITIVRRHGAVDRGGLLGRPGRRILCL